LEKGDQVVVISPAYQSLYEIATGAGCRIIPWEADDSGHYQVENLKTLVTAKTRMVVVNFPHNPTGAMVSPGDFIEISRFCDLNGIVLFSDEMYRGLEQDPADRLPGATSLSVSAVSLSGMSKSFSLPGLRIGWLACRNPATLNKLLQLKDYITICSSAPGEILSIIALQNRENILGRNRDIIAWNIRLVDQFIEDNPGLFSWNPPVAGSVAMLNLLSGQTSEQFCQDLLVEKQVLAIGSHLFNMPKPAIRLGLGRVGFAEALERVTRL
ncbi:MAG TPA: aspartate aminotransferase, partial [Bacteroidales bacterium]|nr:aspartate aminotransferase [Bacteroidales bacterium]